MERAVFASYDIKTRKVSSEKATVQFNPETCHIVKSNKTSTAGRGILSREFIVKEPSTLAMELVFDSYVFGQEKQEDVAEVNECFKLLRTSLINVKTDLHAPPAIHFAWGKTLFVGFLLKFEENYTMFSEAGKRLRVRVKLEIEGATQEELSAGPNESPDRTKLHTLLQGETLWEISDREYGSVGQWRVIAKANKLSNPRKLVSASVLHIPALPGGEA